MSCFFKVEIQVKKLSKVWFLKVNLSKFWFLVLQVKNVHFLSKQLSKFCILKVKNGQLLGLWFFRSKTFSFQVKNCQNFGFNVKMCQNFGLKFRILIFGSLGQIFPDFHFKIVKILVFKGQKWSTFGFMVSQVKNVQFSSKRLSKFWFSVL